MKRFAACLSLLAVFLFGCESTPPPPRPFFGIADAKKVTERGTLETSEYAVVVRYENVIPGKYEVKIGFGYIPDDERLRTLTSDAIGQYAIAHTEVLQKTEGDIRVTLTPTTVRNIGGKMNGKVHAILSEYPHGPEWPVVKHDVFILP